MSQTVHYTTDQPLLEQSSIGRLWPALIEVALLAVAAPLLYFPERVQTQLTKLCSCEAGWVAPLGLALLAIIWPLRRWLTGRWAESMPVAWALWFWFLVMLPVAIWAAPAPLAAQYAWPRAYILVWNYSLFWSVLTYASQSRRALGWALAGWLAAVQLIAILAPFGMEARTKLPIIGGLQELIPRPLLGLFAGAENGFSTNQVAGVLLYALPLMITLCVVGVQKRGALWWLLTLATAWMGMTMLLSQSRGGWLGLLVALLALLLLTRRWGWYALAGLAMLTTLLIFNMPPVLVNALGDAPGVEVVGGVGSVEGFRTIVWSAANAALGDFPFTGIGLGAFRGLVTLLYPLPGIPASYEIPHAHNFFLQTGLDFGVPGLAAILLLYGAAIFQLVQLAHLPAGDERARPLWLRLPNVTPRVLAIGWMGCMVGQTVYSLFDAVAMGSKPNFVWWWWMALIFATSNYVANCLLPNGER